MTDCQRMHDGIMNWIRISDRKPTVDDADESGTVWVYDRVLAAVSSALFYQADSPYYTLDAEGKTPSAAIAKAIGELK